MGTYSYRGDKFNPPGTYDSQTGELLKDVNGNPVPQNPRNGRLIKPTEDKMVNETAKAGLIASAEAAEREAIEHDRRADEKERAILRAPRELVPYYSDQRREHRANAELARERGKSFRRAAAAL